MKLYFSPPSPFSRKVRIAAAVLGLDASLELVPTDTSNPDATLLARNPLGKIPTLELDNGETVFDSAVIVDHLDRLAGGGRVIPADNDARSAALTLEALGDGIAEAALLQVYEQRFRAENERSARWAAHQAAKVARALAHLDAAPPSGDFAQIGPIAVASALGYLDLRFEGAWRKDYPRLAAWLDSFAAAIPAYAATAA